MNNILYYQVESHIILNIKKHTQAWFEITKHWRQCGGNIREGIFTTTDKNMITEFYLTFPYSDSITVTFTDITNISACISDIIGVR